RKAKTFCCCGAGTAICPAWQTTVSFSAFARSASRSPIGSTLGCPSSASRQSWKVSASGTESSAVRSREYVVIRAWSSSNPGSGRSASCRSIRSSGRSNLSPLDGLGRSELEVEQVAPSCRPAEAEPLRAGAAAPCLQRASVGERCVASLECALAVGDQRSRALASEQGRRGIGERDIKPGLDEAALALARRPSVRGVDDLPKVADLSAPLAQPVEVDLRE